MNVVESKRTRHLVIHINRGEELPIALIRALDEVEAKAGIITATGIFDAVEIVSINAQGHSHSRRVNAPSLASLSGNVALEHGTTNIQLFATLSRETTLGHESFSGQISWANVRTLDVFVTVLDDVSLARESDEHGFTSVLNATSRASAATPRVTVQEPSRETTSAPAASPLVTPPPAKTPAKEPEAETKMMSMQSSTPALAPPARPPQPVDDGTELYPDVGDTVTHFHFGECEVISSDGERIRLRQIKDGRVREVSLTMLKIEDPTIDASNKRQFKLSRKH